MKIALLGYGKMGKTIEGIFGKQFPDDEIVLKITSTTLNDLTAGNIRNADVAIEFSRPDTAFDNIQLCLENNVPVVVGTTAWLDRLDEAKAIMEHNNGALFFAPNFSIGVNIFMEINKRLATLMNEQTQYEVSMEEIHHTQKLDAPSGTAVKLANDILQNIDRKTQWVKETPDTSEDLPIRSKREPDIPGTHIIYFQSPIDEIEIKHTARSRRGFAEGAVMAARWLVGKQGYFEMKDLLKL